MKTLTLLVGLTLLLAQPAFCAPALVWQPVCEPGIGGQITSMAIDPADPQHLVMAGDMLGATVSTNGGKTWGGTFGFKSWEDNDFTWSADGKTLWLGTLAGPYVSTDGGKNWQERRAGMPASQWGRYTAPVQKVLIDPVSPSHLLAFAGSHRHWADGRTDNFGTVWDSADGGANWTKKTVVGGDANGKGGGNIVGAFYLPGSSNTLYAAAGGKGIYKSADGGATWAAQNTGLPSPFVNALVFSPRAPQTLWAAFYKGGVYKSADGGASWQAANVGIDNPGGSDFNALAVAADGKTLYLGCYNQNSLYQSADGGGSWQKLTIDCPRAYDLGVQGEWIVTDPKNANRVFACNSVSLFATADGGETWKDTTSFQPSPSTAPALWRGSGYSGLVSQNFTWNPFQPAQSIAQAMDDGKLLLSRDNMQSWQRDPSGIHSWDGGSGAAFCGPGGVTIYAALGMQNGGDGLAKSVDGGHAWTYTPLPAGASRQVSSVYAAPNDPKRVWMVTGGRLFASADGGATWSASLEDNINAVVGDALTDAPKAIYAVGRAGVYQSTDGMTFNLMPGSPTNWAYGGSTLTVDPNDRATLYVCNWGFNDAWHTGLWRRRAGKWELLSSDKYGPVGRAYMAAADPANPRRIAVVTNDNPYSDVSNASGVWLSEDDGKTWTQQNTGLPMLRGQVIRFCPDKSGLLVVGLNGRGFYKTRVSETGAARP